MYLTRMELNTKNRDTMHLLSSPEKIHGLVESAFQGERKRNLWRLFPFADGEQVIHVKIYTKQDHEHSDHTL